MAVTDRNPKNKVIVDNPGTGGWRRFFKFAGIVLIATMVLGVALCSVGVYLLKKDLPSFSSIEEYHPIIGSSVYALDGTIIGEFAIEKRQVVSFEKIPKQLIQAFLAAEDRNFFHHFGIDPYYVVRAAWKNLKAGHFKEGASTITMQLARSLSNLQLTREKKLTRKLKEVILAIFELESNLSKKEILWLYLNQIYLGHGAYGVQQAALTYFNKNVWELSLEECSILAGLPKAPGRDSPYVSMERGKGRKSYVLRRMLEEDYIDQFEHDEAMATPIELHHQSDIFLEHAPHYAEHIRKYIYNTYGEETLYQGGLQIGAAVDLSAQKLAQEALYYGLRNLDHRQGYRGPLANLTRDKWDEFLNTLSSHYDDPIPLRDKIYIGLVTKVDDKRKKTKVEVGKWSAEIQLTHMRWARKPKDWISWEHALVKKPSQTLQAGDVIYVRPSDLEGIVDRFDFRSQAPIDVDKMIWILEQEPKAQAAILSKEPDSGYIIAMVGGYNFEHSEFNRATQACRQPGSAFKPIVYTAAVDKGWHVSTIIMDAPIVDGELEKKWKPENYGAKFKGEVSLRYALQNSLNIPAIKTLDYVGVARSKEMAISLGIDTEIQEDRSISLGSACVNMDDLVNVYAHFPNAGRAPRTIYVTHVMDQSGNILEDHRSYYDINLDVAEKFERMEAEVLSEDVQVLDETKAFIMTWLMTQVVKGGTAAGAGALGRSCGGKTGTTNDSYDAWFMGFTPNLVTGAWIGHDDNSRTLGKSETGGRAALPIWLDFMQQQLKGTEEIDFVEPDSIHWIQVDKKTGRIAVEGASQTIKAPFLKGTKPDETMVMEGEQDPDEFFKMTEFY